MEVTGILKGGGGESGGGGRGLSRVREGKNDQGLVGVGTIRPAVSACWQLRKLGFYPPFLRCWLQQTVNCFGSLEFFQAGT